MAVIKKFGETLTQNLSSFQTYIVDNNPNSTYFKITEFKDSFTGGKNGFLIEGSEHLKETTEIKIQILDVEGNPIYFEPGNGVPEYYEGTSKVVAVYIYEDTPIGTAKITILGELKTYIEEGGVVRDVPDEWKNVYNVKWEKSFQVNRLLSNEDKVRFYRRPKVSISEIVKPIFNNVTTTITQTGSLSGIAQAPRIGEQLAGYSAPTTYLLSIDDTTNWTGSVVGTTINMPSIGYSTVVDSVINNKDVLVINPYTQNGLVSNFANEGYTASFNYIEGVNNLKTALTGSFAKIVLTDLTTFIGDVARVKIFRKSQSDLADYQFIQEIRLESNEILRDLESQIKNEEFYGLFDNTNYKNYWATSSNNIVASFNQNYLYNSIQLDSPNSNYFYTTASLGVTQNIEYTLTFNTRVGEGSVSANNYLRAFLSGSKVATVNGSPKTIQVEKNIVTLTSDNSLLQKNQITANFKAEEANNSKLYFEVKGNDWYISDVSLRASQETAYSPDEITFIQSVPRSLPEETFDYRFEFYDINNNYIPVLVEASKTFNGGNLQRIQKGLVFTPRSLQFQFDSGSNPVPPTVVGFTVTKNLLTGSITYTSQSFDFDGNELFGNQYTSSITIGGGYPGLLDGITSDAPTMTVQHFTGSRSDKTVQLIKITGEVEGFTDTVIFSRVLDGFGGVNHLIRPYRGTQIRNSSTASLELQAIRVDGVNDIELGSYTKPEKGWPDKQLHILVTGSAATGFREKFVNLAFASASGYVKGLTTGSLGSGEINYNATFNRDSIDFRRTVFLMSSQSAASDWAYNTSASVLASIVLEDLQDGLDSGTVTFNADSFTINPRTETLHRPGMAFATASFSVRGTAGGNEFVTASFKVFPSMSINKDFVPEFWIYYTTQSCNPTIAVSAVDDNRYVIPSRATSSFVSSPLSQSKNLTLTFTYTEPWTSASVSFDKTFTIIPEGKPGDETIIFEVTPINVTLAANSRGVVNDFKPSVTEIKLKQGSRYLSFTGSISQSGTFHIAQSSITASNITGGLVYFDNNYTESLIISASSGFINLSGSITYPLIIHPYYTSSIYTQSVVQQYTKVLDGPPPIQIVIAPTSVSIPADEVGYVSSYTNANTIITVKEGDDFLRYTSSQAPGTWKINSIETRTGNNWNIRTGSLVTGSASSSFGTFNRFDYPFVSASALYTIQVYPFALGSGHEYTSSIFQRTQTFTKNVSVPNARTVELKANPYTINYDRDGYKVSPEGDVELKATAQNYTGSTWFTLFYVDTDGSETLYDGPYYEGVPEYTFIVPGTDAAGPEENKTWRVKLTDGNPYTSSILNPFRAEGQLTIAGIKAGADSYKIAADNVNTSITADLYNTNLSGTAIKLPTFKGITQLANVTASTYPSPQPTDYDYLYNLIGILGFSSASIYSKSTWITLASNKILTNPASLPNITAWDRPAINKSGEVVYKVEFEGYSSNLGTNPPTRHTEFITQSFAVQFTEPAPYDVKLTRENAAAVYKVSGEISLSNTSTQITANRGTYVLTNQPGGFTGAQTDAFGSSSYQGQFRVQISAKSGHLTLNNGSLGVGSYLSGNPASMPGVTAWSSPETNRTAVVVYEINCEGRQTFYKTQSFSIQFEGETGPGIVMRGEWEPTIDYIGSVETLNNRRDAVTYLATPNDVKYYAAISGSGPATYDGNGVLVNYHAPTPSGTNAWWEYLGDQEFFVAAKMAIFEESYVKNTINVGTYNNTSKYANIILAGGRPDPYISIGQHGTVGTAGTSGTSINPSTSGAAGTSGTGVIGYDRPGIFMGLYEQGASGTYGRLSIKDYSGNNYMKWDGEALILSGLLNAGGMKLGRGVNGANNGLYLNANNYWYDTGTNFKVGGPNNYLEWDGNTLTLRGSLRQVVGGDPEGTHRGNWAASTAYYVGDVVFYIDSSYICITAHTSTNNTNVNTGYPPNATNSWTVYAAAGTSGTAGSGGTAGSSGINGAQGDPGAGVVYRGPFTIGTQYFRNPAAPTAATRRDVVQGNDGAYYLCKLTYTPTDNSTRPPDGGSYSTYWESFGATFSSVATDILLAQNASITRGLVLGQSGTFGGFVRSANADSLVGPSGGAGFYLQDDGKFRFGNITGSGLPYIYWDNANLTIKGKIITDNTVVSEIGNWRVEQGKLQDANEFIVLDPTNITFTINNLSDEKVIEISQANLPAVGGGGGTFTMSSIATINLDDTYDSTSPFLTEVTNLDTTGVSISSPGQYKVNSISWGANPFYLQANGSFSGYFYFEIYAEVWDSPDFTGNLIHQFFVGYSDSLGGPYDEGLFYSQAGYPQYITIPANDTYYFHIRAVVQSYIDSGTATISGATWSINNGNVFNKQLSQINVAGNGFLAAADVDNYVKIERSTIVPLVDVASNSSVPAVRIENAHASAAALEIVDGPLDMSNQNIVDVNTLTWNLATSGYEGTIGTISAGSATRPSIQLKNIAGSSQVGGTLREVQIRIDGPNYQWWICRFDSSARFKYGIENWNHPSLLDAINNVPIRNFYWNVDKESENPPKQIGIIAEELESAGLEEFVDYDLEDDTENPTGPQKKVVRSIAKTDLIFVLWKAVQELSQRVESLEAAISGSK